ncbi:MAG: LytTR family transcriptional regulator DNA-binding domain-containing protein [Bacteroidales bacterium]
MKVYKALIIEDEAPARDLLLHYLKNYPQIEVVGHCQDGFEGIKAISSFTPDIIFLDISMPRLSGFEMLELVDEDSMPLTIFTTAYDQYAIKAFEYNALDYLLKPIAPERFDQAMSRALEKLASGKEALPLNQVLESKWPHEGFLDRVVVRSGAGIHVIPGEDILCLESKDDYVLIYTRSREEFLKKKTLKYYEQHLDPRRFLRVHRSCILALEAIQKIEAYSKDAWIAVLKNDMKFPVSKAGYTSLRKIFDF